MRLSNSLPLLSLLFAPSLADLLPRTYDTHDFFALHLDDSVTPEYVAAALGARHEGQIGSLPGHHKFSLPQDQSSRVESLLEDLRVDRKLKKRSSSYGKRGDGLDGVLWSQKLALKDRLHKRVPIELVSKDEPAGPQPEAVDRQKRIASDLAIKDPLFQKQWHLFNTVQLGHDLNVTGVWLEGITGEGVVTAIVDDGLDMYSNDLKDNYFPEGSWDFNENAEEPKPLLFEDKHGTRCAGEVAAVRNGVCGVGMAYDSKVAGIRILSKPIDDADEAAAINYGFQKNDIYSCSWGPRDDGQTMEAPGILVRRAMVNGIVQGRDGKGSIFVFAAGNGGMSGDNCNFDGYTNSIYSITVGALDRRGGHPSYSEACSAQLVVAYSSGGGDHIHTTDVGTDTCTNAHGGTSAAGPLAAGAIALGLSVRPDLTWRDVQYILLETAVPVHADDDEVQMTPIGKEFSHQYGYGKVDTYSFVQKAKNWELVKPQAWYTSPWLRVEKDVPQGNQGLASYFDVNSDMLKDANLERVEHVTITMNVNHTRRGDISVELRGPQGIVSHLSVPRKNDEAQVGYVDWTFMSVAHWGESGEGVWSVVVKDTVVNDNTGVFIDWRMTLWGVSIDPEIQQPHPLPDEHDDDHDIEDAVYATVSIKPHPVTTAAPTATDHAERPTKPTNTEAKPTATPEVPTPVDEELSEEPTDSDTAEPTASTSPGFLPSFLPTFGATPHTQVWIYASIALILVFCLALGIYFYVQRRNRLRNNPHDDYEFEIIDDEDDAAAPLAGRRGRKRRGGELYNAFAEESDEELLSGNDDDEEGPFRDHLKEKDGEHH
ncbi:pheromone processing endoprotease KexB [Talaromyces stipitatus ATCC 10500]|uniref:Pheromone processing endoprotease KexB n=1 Tax=Talaromyces stipitatus (strain ATCC 10500 / CBS 375.48 / QM 6759 / NRRL 1006) TaxID=441959 RepID=B8LXM9_TALSN|nr:pheromone processing endoprotease KexB [Talaromyces stipitatus ATCC 10500]EED24530.1 pheromone processing endoprotease KexB [Talaromyces stipitatus ATCC 10500]